MAKATERARTRLREEQRAARKVSKLKARLHARGPGGSPGNPLEVTSSSVVEVRARAASCPQCGKTGEWELRGDKATSTPRGVLRELTMACRQCREPTQMWFRIVSGSSS